MMISPQFGQNPFQTPAEFANVWTATNETDEREQLLPPTITVTQGSPDYNIQIQLTPMPNANNYRLFVNGSFIIQGNQADFNYEAPRNGEYRISVRAFDTTNEFRPSASSNIVTVIVTDRGFMNLLSTGMRMISTGIRKILISEVE
jgi:hypothetical protein